jgi:hypothetical protein
MTIVYPTTADERRFTKALHILSGAASWTAFRADAGAAVYRIPSQSEPGVSYETDGCGCSCPDFLGRLERGGPAGPCKHALAVQLRVANSAPAYAEVYGSDRGHDAATCRLTICPYC